MTTQLDQTSFLTGANAVFIEELFARYLDDPNSVDPSWRTVFQAWGEEAKVVHSELKGASWGRQRSQVIGAVDPTAVAAKPAPAKTNGAAATTNGAAPDPEQMRRAAQDS